MPTTAVPVPSIGSGSPIGVPSSRLNCTEPVGTPAPGGSAVTVTVNVANCPATTDAGSTVTAVVVSAAAKAWAGATAEATITAATIRQRDTYICGSFRRGWWSETSPATAAANRAIARFGGRDPPEMRGRGALPGGASQLRGDEPRQPLGAPRCGDEAVDRAQLALGVDGADDVQRAEARDDPRADRRRGRL